MTEQLTASQMRQLIFHELFENTIEHQFILSIQRFIYYENGVWTVDYFDEWITAVIVNIMREHGFFNSAHFITSTVKQYKMFNYGVGMKHSEFLTDFNNFSRRIGQHVYINVKNGVLDVNTHSYVNVLDPHSSDMYFLDTLNVEYTEHAECPIFIETLTQIIPDRSDRKIFRYFLAYSLVNRYFGWQTCLYLFGDGANGKSTLIHPLLKLFSNYSAKRLDQMTDNTHGTATLVNKQLLYANESNKNMLDTSVIKSITAGEPINVNPKGFPDYEAVIDAKLIITANRVPKLSQESELRRFLLIKCPNKFTGKRDNPDLIQRLDEEIPGIFNWIVKAIPRVFEEMQSLKTGIVERSFKIVEKYGDSVSWFVNTFFYSEDGNTISNEDIQRAYTIVRKAFSLDIIDVRRITRKITDTFPYARRINRRGIRGYENIALNWAVIEELKTQ